MVVVIFIDCNILLNFLQGAITKRMTAIEEMAGMDVLCSDKTGTLTLNKLTVDKNLIEVGDRNICLSTSLLKLTFMQHQTVCLGFLKRCKPGHCNFNGC